MKKKVFALMMLFAVILISCGEEESDEFCENPEASCPDGTAIDATACCTDADCHWTYNSTDYECDGDDCSSVLDLIIENACTEEVSSVNLKSGKTLAELKAELASVTQKLLAEARAASGCN